MMGWPVVALCFDACWLGELSHERLVPPHVWHLLTLNLIYWYIPAVLAPVIMRNALRHPLDRVRWPKQLVVHIAGALAYSVLHTGILVSVRVLLMGPGSLPSKFDSWRAYVVVQYLTQLDWLFVTYLFLIGLAYALEYRGESEARALSASRLETRLVEAQLQSLQRQLHPHFLFNTLNTISGLIRTDADAADVMIDRLGDLLRMTLHKSGIQEVTLKEELDVLRKYVEIEQTRFGSRLHVAMQIEPETLDAQVPNLLLQPLVENAIRHGTSPRTGRGRILIRAARVGDQIEIGGPKGSAVLADDFAEPTA